jgi:DNA gyrase inhibitor GyrI
MPVDPITQKHLDRLRVRGAPSAIPGSVGFVGTYEAEETWRQTGRALVTPLERSFGGAALKTAYARLADEAARYKLMVADEPMFALKGDPSEDPPHTWAYEAVLPIRGAAKLDEGTTLTRVSGGMHIAAITTRGLADLQSVYVYLFGKFLPAKKQQLMRPYLLHHVVDGLDAGRDDRLTIAVYVPAVLSIKPVPISGEGRDR